MTVLTLGIVTAAPAMAQLLNEVTIDAPSSAAGTYLAAGASFGPALTVGGISGDVVLVSDGTAAPSEACFPLVGFPAGAIALIDRGSCSFVVKVSNAQAAGAAAVIVVNNTTGSPIVMGGSDPTITIPSVMVSQADGNTIKAGLPATGTVSLRVFDADLSLSKTAVFDETHVLFTLTVINGGPDEAPGVVVTDTLPAGLEYVSDDCGGSNLPPWTWNIGTLANGAETSCVITTLPTSEGLVSNTASVTSDADDPEPDNDTDEASVLVDFPDALATFAVEKVFTDGNPAAVEVAISCNTGLPLEQTATIAPGGGVTFVVTEFVEGEMDCVVTEATLAGYSAEYDNGFETTDVSCTYEAIEYELESTCTITNSPDPVEITIEKVWVIESGSLDSVNADFRLTLYCDGEIVGTPGGEQTFYGNSDAIFGALVIPNYPSTHCWVEEAVYDSAVEVNNGCGNLQISAGSGDSCVVTNSVFFEGIPSLNRYGLAILILLVSGLAFVTFRRSG